MQYAYQTLRANVYRRKGRNFWALTFEEFKDFAIAFEYVGKSGRHTTGYTIDAKDPTMGYFVGNIRTVHNGINSRKRRKFLHYEWSEHDGRMIAFTSDNEIADTPASFDSIENPF